MQLLIAILKRPMKQKPLSLDKGQLKQEVKMEEQQLFNKMKEIEAEYLKPHDFAKFNNYWLPREVVEQSTNVLSFPYNEIRFFEHKKKKVILGDIVISLEKVLEESSIENKNFANHLTHMTVHSVLHLFGFTHEKQKDFNIMKNKEVSVLTKLQISSPY